MPHIIIEHSANLASLADIDAPMTADDSVSAQFTCKIDSFAKPTFERFRRTRHTAQYFDPDAPEISTEDAQWAIDTAQSVLAATGSLSRSGELMLFDP